MKKIVTPEQAVKIAQKLNAHGNKIVLVGGCFDILHVGHLEFLKKAKEQADFLFVLLESDERVKKIKGRERPFNPQSDRAKILAALEMVDFVIPIPHVILDKEYDALVVELKPAIIATTKGDGAIRHKKRQAELVDAKVVEVIDRMKGLSTSKIYNVVSAKQ